MFLESKSLEPNKQKPETQSIFTLSTIYTMHNVHKATYYTYIIQMSIILTSSISLRLFPCSCYVFPTYLFPSKNAVNTHYKL